MKKYFLIIALVFSTFVIAQQEVKLNIANALVIKTLDISYEFYINDESSIGISGLYNFEKKSSDFKYLEETMITPYFRHYFTSDKSWNLFGEGFFGVSSGHKEIELDGANTFKKYTDGALGIAIGSKYISAGGLVVDIYGGLGRNLFSSNSPVLVPRLGVNVGWRF